MNDVHGEVAPGFEAVREAFARNFAEHGEVGAAVSIYHRGQKVVDLWGGVADIETGRTWEEDGMQLVFSTTKGAAAICANLLAQRGELDVDAPVASLWPEFAAEGKGEVPVRWLLSHRVGLPALDEQATPEELFAWEPFVAKLAAQKPLWEPGTAHGYHAMTYGHLVGEVVRRASGRSIGTYFAEEIAGPLGLDFYIGLPEALEARVSPLVQTPIGEPDLSQVPEAQRDLIAKMFGPDSIMARALMPTTPPVEFNSREAHAAEIPAAGGITTARSLARLYAAQVGEVDGVRILGPEQLAKATEENSKGPDRVLMAPTRFGLGFMLPSDFSPLFGPRSFGHPGAGGSVGFGDPDAEIGFGYIMNKMQQNLAGDPRSLGLVDALKRSLAAL